MEKKEGARLFNPGLLEIFSRDKLVSQAEYVRLLGSDLAVHLRFQKSIMHWLLQQGIS